MLVTLFLVVGGTIVVVFVLLVVVVIGIKQEPSAEELTSQPPNAITAWVRHLLGVYVRKPDQPPVHYDDDREPCLTAWEPPAGQKDPRNEGLSAVTPIRTSRSSAASPTATMDHAMHPTIPGSRKEVTAIAGLHGRAGS